MGQLRVDRGGQPLTQRGDAFGNILKLLQMGLWVAFVGGAVGDHGEALAQGGGEFLVDGRRGGHEKEDKLRDFGG